MLSKNAGKIAGSLTPLVGKEEVHLADEQPVPFVSRCSLPKQAREENRGRAD